MLEPVQLPSAIRKEMANEKVDFNAISHGDPIYAGPVGAALWGACRHEKLAELEAQAAA